MAPCMTKIGVAATQRKYEKNTTATDIVRKMDARG
ncbi:hypothetical protein T4B_11836 [Trichinella pseudospiralis]|uniref:Uncharacterized protein n=1 Tax=Trichinella pseudospiralis TaxID=6337 RepID=A0A0V1GG65_TRIPS|nr:hypothetical protein T4B_11836 [Trichinella pseudospiralis]